MGFAFAHNLVHDLKPLLSPAALNEYAQNSIGATFESYSYAGRLLALPIDAATPAPSWRGDLLERAEVSVPGTWTEAVALARRKLAVIPAFIADLFLHFLMLVKRPSGIQTRAQNAGCIAPAHQCSCARRFGLTS